LGHILAERIALVSKNARIVKVFHPVFSPDESTDDG
jgi:hypothetical protein